MRRFSRFRLTARLKFRFETVNAACTGNGCVDSVFWKTTLSGYAKKDSPEENISPIIFWLQSLSSFLSVNSSIDLKYNKKGEINFPLFCCIALFWLLSFVVFFNELLQRHCHRRGFSSWCFNVESQTSFMNRFCGCRSEAGNLGFILRKPRKIMHQRLNS